jgi:hypothetical protein
VHQLADLLAEVLEQNSARSYVANVPPGREQEKVGTKKRGLQKDCWERKKLRFTCHPYPNKRVPYWFELSHPASPREALHKLAHVSLENWTSEAGLYQLADLLAETMESKNER